MTRPRFNRILLKLSGEALMGPGQFGIDPALIQREQAIAEEKAKESGKPANIVEKMVEGSMAKFRKEHSLVKNEPVA